MKSMCLKSILSGISPSLQLFLVVFSIYIPVTTAQTISIDGKTGGKNFDGIGAVSGGGATSVLLKDYPEPQRSQILDFLFKPKFGASLSALLVEVPGDGNSTQGSEPSHMHSKNDENYSRGYEWWIMTEAKKRNPSITLDANAWSCPGWVGNNNFWSQDMCDYYVKWIKGLKNVYGLDLDAIGCRNERGVNKDFVKIFRISLNKNGFQKVKIHAFDNWQKDKFDWCWDMIKDTALRNSVDIISNHTMSEIPTPSEIIKLSRDLDKPIWNSEEHIYKDDFDCEISLVESFNRNFIESGVTKIINWYLVGSTYTTEPYAEKPAMMIAREPWSGNYYIRQVLWGYAHYGQFSEAGWQYVNGACGKLNGGGTYVTLKSPKSDYSIIVETKDTSKKQTMINQKVSFKVSGGLSKGNLCVWRSNATSQFERLDDIVPVNGSFDITFEPNSIYSISTTNGQQKGSFENVPASKHFPFPYYETFEEYNCGQEWGFLPNYTADIAGIFEIADRSDHKGKCLRQVISEIPQSWAPEWQPYTIFGDTIWSDYEFMADIYIENSGTVGLMGRLNGTGYGYGGNPDGYYITVSSNGKCDMYVITQKDTTHQGKLLASEKLYNVLGNQWHTIKLQFSGSEITGFVDGIKVIQTVDSTFSHGMTGLMILDENKIRCTAQFDNIVINSLNGILPLPRKLPKNVNSIYKKALTK